MRITSIDDVEVRGKTVLLRPDINSPIDRNTGKIVNENRIDKSLPTIADLADAGARLVIIAHQGDTLDYHNLVSLKEHAGKLAAKLNREVKFIDDVAEGMRLVNVRIDDERFFTGATYIDWLEEDFGIVTAGKTGTFEVNSDWRLRGRPDKGRREDRRVRTKDGAVLCCAQPIRLGASGRQAWTGDLEKDQALALSTLIYVEGEAKRSFTLDR